MKKFFSPTNIIILISILQLGIMLLPYFGIQPPEKSTNWILKIWALLWIKIPLIVVIFTLSIGFIFLVWRKQNTLTSKNKNPITATSNEINGNPEKNQHLDLKDEHNFILLSLLNISDRSLLRDNLYEVYTIQFNKITADFNILRQELLEWDLIDELHSLGRYYWKLTSKGINVAKEKYRSKEVS